MKDIANLEQKLENIKAQVASLDIKIDRLVLTKDNLNSQAELIKRQIELEK